QLVDVTRSSLFILDDSRDLPQLTEALRLGCLSQLLRTQPVKFDEVLSSVRRTAQALSTPRKHLQGSPTDVETFVATTIHQYYMALLRRSSEAQAQVIVASSLTDVSRLLAEKGMWGHVRSWIDICQSADAEAVNSCRQLKLLVEADPLELPPP